MQFDEREAIEKPQSLQQSLSLPAPVIAGLAVGHPLGFGPGTFATNGLETSDQFRL